MHRSKTRPVDEPIQAHGVEGAAWDSGLEQLISSAKKRVHKGPEGALVRGLHKGAQPRRGAGGTANREEKRGSVRRLA
jgi:hypothetical protein